MDRAQIAKENFTSGKNCSQSVVLAFKDVLGLDEQTLNKLSLAFGGGFARKRLICGAVSGMAMVISSVYTNKQSDNKIEVYKIVQKACDMVEKELGSIICADLLQEDGKDTSPNAEPRTKEYYKKRPCAEICAIVAKITQEIISQKV